MTIHNKPNYNIGVWASNGTITQPTSEKIEEGHVVEKPKYEIVNYIENKQDVGIAYLLQKGIPDWDSLTEYPENAFTQYNGVVYRALSQNLDKQPNLNIGIWTTAWAGADVSNEVTNIKTIDGYLGFYVQKATPVMTGKATGVAYTANSGLINTGAEPYGYAFNNNLRDGLFHNGISPVIQNDGTVVAKFEDVLGNTADNSVNVATTAWVQKFVAEATRIKVGDLYFSTDGTNPAIRLGYGTWEKYAKGHAIVGHHDDTSSNTPDWVKNGGNTYGSYTHTLTVDQIPSHKHTSYYADNAAQNTYPNGYESSGHKGSSSSLDSDNVYPYTSNTGGNQPHNNVQPSIVVFVWKRTS